MCEKCEQHIDQFTYVYLADGKDLLMCLACAFGEVGFDPDTAQALAAIYKLKGLTND